MRSIFIYEYILVKMSKGTIEHIKSNQAFREVLLSMIQSPDDITKSRVKTKFFEAFIFKRLNKYDNHCD